MRDNKFIDDRTYAIAVESPVKVVFGRAESSDAPYFVDLVSLTISKNVSRVPIFSNSPRASTLRFDLDLQRFANEAVAAGMKEVDAAVHRNSRDSSMRRL